jgi:hypothetical protein
MLQRDEFEAKPRHTGYEFIKGALLHRNMNAVR